MKSRYSYFSITIWMFILVLLAMSFWLINNKIISSNEANYTGRIKSTSASVSGMIQGFRRYWGLRAPEYLTNLFTEMAENDLILDITVVDSNNEVQVKWRKDGVTDFDDTKTFEFTEDFETLPKDKDFCVVNRSLPAIESFHRKEAFDNSTTENHGGNPARRQGKNGGMGNRLNGPRWENKKEQDQTEMKLRIYFSLKEYQVKQQNINKMRLGLYVFWGIVFITAFLMLRKNKNMEINLKIANEKNNELERLNLLASGIAHETKNPLSIIRGNAQIISETEDFEEIKHRAEFIILESDKTTAKLMELLSFTKTILPKFEHVNLREVIEDVSRLLFNEANKCKILTENLPTILADKKLLNEILVNVILNSLSIKPDVIVECSIKIKNSYVSLLISDNGPGVEEDKVGLLTKPYYSLRPDGTGLGLAICQKNAKVQNWTLTLRNRKLDTGFEVEIGNMLKVI